MASVNPGIDPDSEYFDNRRIFMLSGHGNQNPDDVSYTLNNNEFYAAPARCGFVTMGSDLKWFSFLASNPKIKIPTSESKSFYTLNYEDFPFKTTKSIKNTNLNQITLMPLSGKTFNEETNAFKMYVPFSSKEKTKTIPNNIFTFFSFHSHKTKLPITKKDFIFNGKTYETAKLGNYIAGTIMPSGILSPNTDTKVFEEEFDKLQVESDALLNAIGYFPTAIRPTSISFKGRTKINVSGKFYNEPSQAKYVLFIILPSYGFDVNYFDRSSNTDPLLNYCKSVMQLMSSLSVIPIEEFKPDQHNFENILFAQQPVSQVFRLIRNKLRYRSPENENKPFLLLNPLCRNITDIRKTSRLRTTNETNIRSLSKNKSTKRYQNFKRKIHRYTVNVRDPKKILSKLYGGPVTKKIIDIPLVSNLTGLNVNSIQQFLNTYNNDNIIVNNSVPVAGGGGNSNTVNRTMKNTPPTNRRRGRWCTRKGCKNFFKGIF